MFSVTVRDHVMVAHSLAGEVFGPAQGLHGATFTVDATFRGEHLDDDGVLVDIGRATDALRRTLDPLRHRNLDELDEFAGRNTTTEVLAAWVADRLVEELRGGGLGGTGLDAAAGTVTGIIATLHESHVAWASCERTP